MSDRGQPINDDSEQTQAISPQQSLARAKTSMKDRARSPPKRSRKQRSPQTSEISAKTTEALQTLTPNQSINRSLLAPASISQTNEFEMTEISVGSEQAQGTRNRPQSPQTIAEPRSMSAENLNGQAYERMAAGSRSGNPTNHRLIKLIIACVLFVMFMTLAMSVATMLFITTDNDNDEDAHGHQVEPTPAKDIPSFAPHHQQAGGTTMEPDSVAGTLFPSDSPETIMHDTVTPSDRPLVAQTPKSSAPSTQNSIAQNELIYLHSEYYSDGNCMTNNIYSDTELYGVAGFGRCVDDAPTHLWTYDSETKLIVSDYDIQDRNNALNNPYCLAVNPEDPARVVVSQCQADDAHIWELVGGRIKLAATDQCLEVSYSDIVLSTCAHSEIKQKWSSEKVASHYYESIRSNYWGGQCLGLRGDLSGGAALLLQPCGDYSDQKWYYNGQTKQIVNGVYTDRCLEVPSAGNNAQVMVPLCNSGVEQQWTIRGNRIKSSNGQCLDASKGEDTMVLSRCAGTGPPQPTPQQLTASPVVNNVSPSDTPAS